MRPQAAAYEAQIQLRREAGELPQVRHVLVIPDQDGRRVGSGGSTLQCLAEVLRRESQPGEDWSDLQLRGGNLAPPAHSDRSRRRRLPAPARVFALRQDLHSASGRFPFRPGIDLV